MWIAKNSITGKTYGNKYSSIYDCQKFIDSKLILLEYEFQKVYSLEQEVERDLKSKGIMELFSNAFKDLEKSESMMMFRKGISLSVQGKSEEKIHEELEKYALTRWHKNNIIRCYNVSQHRYADGFDF